MRNTWKLGLAALLALGGLAACKNEGGDQSAALSPMGKNEKATIKVMYFDGQMFNSQYGSLFRSKFPNLELQVVSSAKLNQPNTDWMKAFKTFIDEEQPDVLVMDDSQYEKLVNEGRLVDLEATIKNDSYDLTGIQPNILELLRAKGGGKLHGLAPRFFSRAIFYNKTLFDQYGVPYPKDQMTWDEVVELAKRFPTDGAPDKRIYGFYMPYDLGLVSLATEIGSTNGQSLLDSENGKVTIQTDGWKKAYQTAINAYQSPAFFRPDRDQQTSEASSADDFYRKNLFLMGRAAMMSDSSFMTERLIQAKDILKDVPAPNWDLVTVPVNPANRESGRALGLHEIMAINAKSGNPRAAWAFIKYVSGDEYAKIVSQSPSNGFLLSRSAYLKEKDGRSMEPFYKLKPMANGGRTEDEQNAPPGFMQKLGSAADKELNAVLEGKETLDTALQQLQSQGQSILDESRKSAVKSADATAAP